MSHHKSTAFYVLYDFYLNMYKYFEIKTVIYMWVSSYSGVKFFQNL
jgi:hypothetical protein